MEEVTVRSADEMRAFGRGLASRLRSGDLVVLTGPLGAGKTTLVQGIGAGLNVRGPITSPTFVIARVHPPLGGARDGTAPGPALVHVDAYRLGGPAEVDDLDLDMDLDSAVTVVEWGGGLVEGLSDDRLEVTISLAGDEPGEEPRERPVGEPGEEPGGGADEARMVRVSGTGARWAAAGSSARTP